jgi:hypothetical protein
VPVTDERVNADGMVNGQDAAAVTPPVEIAQQLDEQVGKVELILALREPQPQNANTGQ